jgi:hypothetical protein
MPACPLNRVATKGGSFSLFGCSLSVCFEAISYGLYKSLPRILFICLFAPATAAIAASPDARRKPSPILTALTSCKATWKHSESVTLIAAVYFPPDQYGTILRLYDGNRFLLKTGICLNLGRYRFKYPDGTSLSRNSESLQIYILTIPANQLELGKHTFTLQGTHTEQPLTVSIE